MLGTQLGPYELLEEIGKGGMATVYRAYQPAIDRQVAVKVIHRSIANDTQALERFRREARIIARLEHPHILPVYDFDGVHDPPYIVMRYLDCGTLKDMLKVHCLPLDEAAYLLRQIASALDYAHRQGVIHRDVKPSNVLLDREGNAIVSDFGIARLTVASTGAADLTQSGAILGTPDYISPEQIKGESVDLRADIYALGVMAFEMLVGQLPYQDSSPALVLIKHIQAPVPSPASLKPGLPPALQPVFERALAKAPHERYPTVMAFAAELLAALGGTPTSTPASLRAVVQESLAPARTTAPFTGSSLTLAEQHKVVTAMQLDATEYIELVEETEGSEAARNALSGLWLVAEEIVDQHGGQVLVRAEGTLLALWGAETAHEDDPERALHAALTLRTAVCALDARLIQATPGTPVPLRIGINTGTALLTPDPSSGTYTVSGTAIRLASRLAERADGVILIAPDTYQAVRGAFDVELDESIGVRGRRERLQTYRVVAAKPRVFRPDIRGVEGIQTRLIGREPELAQMQEAYLAAIEEGETQWVTVVGGAGLGKSRLLFEFGNWAELRPETYRLFRGRARPVHGAARPYALLRDVLAFRFEIYDSDSPAAVREKMERGVAGLWPAARPETAHWLGQLAGFDFCAADSPHLKPWLDDPQELARRARTAFIDLFASLCANEAAVIELEDVHHADDASLGLLSELAREHGSLHLLLVCTARPELFERYPAWGSLRDSLRLDLRPLSRRTARRLVREILQRVETVPDLLVDLILERAEGNPYYIEELVKMLIEDRVILKGPAPDSAWSVEEGRLQGWQRVVPTSLVGLLQARLDSLLYPERIALQRAATFGQVFWDSALLALEASDGVTFPMADVLAALAAREFIYPRESSVFEGSREYAFAQGMLRDVVYDNLVKRQKQAYHAAAAEWLVAAAGERAAEYALTIAGHYEQAEEAGQASTYLLHAADQARLAYAHPEAIDCYRRALTFLEEKARSSQSRQAYEQAARTLMKLGLAYHNALDFEQAHQAYERAFASWQQMSEAEQDVALPLAPHALRLVYGNPPSLDPTMAQDTISGMMLNQLFSALVELDVDMSVVPDAARRWDILDAGRTLIFHLRDDVRWSDGTLLTAGDFEYAWKRAMHPATASPNAELFYPLKGARAFHAGECDEQAVGVHALDELILAVELEGPAGYFFHMLTHTAYFPLPRHIVEAQGRTWAQAGPPVTCGPFTLESWQPGQSVVMARNLAYYGQFTGNVQQVEFLSPDFEDWPAILAMYEADQVDVVNMDVLPPHALDRTRQRYAGEYVSKPSLGTWYIGFDTRRLPFDDLRVRRAFALTIDRPGLSSATLGAHFPAGGGFVPPGMPGHSPAIGLPYDPALARQLLAEAGYPPHASSRFPEIEALLLDYPAPIQTGQYLQARWQADLGVKVAWEKVNMVPYLERIEKDPPHLFMFGWMADYPDPDTFLRACPAQQRWAGWQNEAYARLVEEASQASDQAGRMKMYAEADRLLTQAAVLVPLSYLRMHLLVKPWIAKFLIPAMGRFLLKDVVINPHG